MHKWQNDDWDILQAQEPAPMLVRPWRGQGDICEINRLPPFELPKSQKDTLQIPENKVSFFNSTKWQFWNILWLKQTACYFDFVPKLKYTALFKNLSKDLLSLVHAERKLEQVK